MINITTSKPFKELIFPLSEQEYHLLEQNILKEGVRDPLVVWAGQNGRKGNILLDGHHRYRVCQKNHRKFRVVKLKFDNADDAMTWMVDNQLGKRNVSPEAISYLRGLRYKLQRGKRGGNNANSQNVSSDLADKYKISEMTVFRDLKYTECIDTICSKFEKREQLQIKNKILARQTTLSKKDVIDIVDSGLGIRSIRQIISGKKELWQIKMEQEKKRRAKKIKLPRITIPKDIKLHHGDCCKILKSFPKNSIDSAYIDPLFGVGLKGKEYDNFSPEVIEARLGERNPKYIGNRSKALVAGRYDLSYAGSIKYQKWCSKWAKEVIRVVKPGSFILVSCSPRMFARLTCGIEDVGFEVKSCLLWIFGSGFPVSNQISEHIDKIQGKKSKVICENQNRKNRANWDQNDKVIKSPTTKQGQEWEGWYNQLKSSYEPILLAKKPLEKGMTIGESVLKWGVGGLNIEATKVRNEGKERITSNVILSEDAGTTLNQQAGNQVSQYFYCPKPNAKEKEDANQFPAIKPVELIRYLTRLITPKGGTCLDCMMGSGTTGIAAVQEGFKFVGIEKEKEYHQIARRRIYKACKESTK